MGLHPSPENPPSAGIRQADATLGVLLAELQVQRIAMQQVLGTRPSDPTRQMHVRRGLLSCLEHYVAALGSRNLPVPPRLRDELSLQRSVVTGERRGLV